MKQEYTEVNGKFYLKSKVIMLPANVGQIGCIYKTVKNNLSVVKDNSETNLNNHVFGSFQHLYFISDEEIKYNEEYWRINSLNFPEKVKCIFPNTYPKIIATTDQTMNFEPIQFGTTNTLRYNLPRPSNEFLKRYCEKGGIDTVLVEYIDNGHNVDMEDVGGMDEGDTCWMPKIELKTAPDNTITIQSIQKSQSELWDEAFRVLWNRNVSEGTKEALIREKYSITKK